MRITLNDTEGHELVIWSGESVSRPAAYGERARWMDSLELSVALPEGLAVAVDERGELIRLTGRPPYAPSGAESGRASESGSSARAAATPGKMAQYRLRLRRRADALGRDVASEAEFWAGCGMDMVEDWVVEPVRARCAKWLSGLGAVLLDAGAAIDPVAAGGTGGGAGPVGTQHVREMLAALGGIKPGEHLRVTVQGDPARGRTKLVAVERDHDAERVTELRQHLVEQHAVLGLPDSELGKAHHQLHRLDDGQPAAQPQRYAGYVPHYEAEREGATAPAQAGGAEDPQQRDEAWGEPGTPGEISVPAPQVTERHDPPCLYGGSDCVMGNVPHALSGCITQEAGDRLQGRLQGIDVLALGDYWPRCPRGTRNCGGGHHLVRQACRNDKGEITDDIAQEPLEKGDKYEGKPCPREVDQCSGGHSAAESCRNESGFKLALWINMHMGPTGDSGLYALHQNSHQQSGGPDNWGEGTLRHHLARQHHLPDPEQYIVDAKGESPPVVLRRMHAALHHPSPFQQVTVRGRTLQERDELRRSGPPAPPSSDVYPNIDAIPAIETHEAHGHSGYPTWGESTMRWHLQQHHGGDLGTAGMDLAGLTRLHERSHNHGRDEADWPGREPHDG